jgi:hypothetical protein
MLTSYVNYLSAREWLFEVLSNKENNHLLLIAKVQFVNNEIVGLAALIKANLTDRDLFIEYLSARLSILVDSYKDTPINKIQFDYIEREGIADDDRSLLKKEEYTVSSYNYNNLNLPLPLTNLEKCSQYKKLMFD